MGFNVLEFGLELVKICIFYRTLEKLASGFGLQHLRFVAGSEKLVKTMLRKVVGS